MGLRINTNVNSMTAQRNLFNAGERLSGNFSRLASGLRIASAADDAAGLGISERMRSKLMSLGANSRNAQDGVSLVQTAEGALAEAGNNLNRMRELAVQAANGTLNDNDRAALHTEFSALIEEIDRIADSTNFNDVDILNSTNSVNIQVGTESGDTIAVTFADVTANTLGISAASVSTQANAVTALATIDTAIQSVADARGDFGATQNRLESAVRSIANARENLAAAESRIRDVDVAFETADLTRNSIMQQASLSVLAQANVQPQLALSLLG